jgi:hypothetical protein
MTRVVCEAGHRLVEMDVDGQDLPDGCPLCPQCARRWLIARVKHLEALLLEISLLVSRHLKAPSHNA